MFYNIFLTTFALAFGKQPSRALDGRSKEMLKNGSQTKFFSKNFGNSKKWLYLCKVFGSQKSEDKKA